MQEITPEHVRAAIGRFCDGLYQKKAESELKKLEKARLSQNESEIAALEATLAELKQKYLPARWIASDALRFATQLKFGSHISKGVHPDAKGDNIYFQTAFTLPPHLAGSQLLSEPALDANGNAAALPLAAFLNLTIDDAGRLKLRDLLQENHAALQGCFADDEAESARICTVFQTALKAEIDQPVCHERNKQILWPLGEDAAVRDDYVCLVPLHPSALVHEVYQRIHQIRYGEASKAAKEARFKHKENEMQPYFTTLPMGVVKLGGSQPQNVSQLTSRQGGLNYLLPALPPQFARDGAYQLKPQHASFFNRSLRYACREPFENLKRVVVAKKSIMQIRHLRQDALEHMLGIILDLAEHIQTAKPAGWSRDFPQLPQAQKYWLDPNRAALEGEADFQTGWGNDWETTVQQHFTLWLNSWFKQQFPKKAAEFNDAEYQQWYRDMRHALRAAQRNGRSAA
ncbi:type I-F CRISPR-associated protein Csy1 [Uruburuella testudinis]|uniref:Type I-F CRISPR-associated protein Csy1 n=1 Tax=Uruburuella testudinis TaxID=1282863 RepID=A0ABY4DVQ7_9NEIS|nr:type I-F CRISPR-associated protein Csy1 [Uruburuella testudinis]UOO82558.1 type I-F CRISPR-associated protein Csy1 [Uruburuella testudinis]